MHSLLRTQHSVRFPQPNIQLQARFLLSNKSPPEHPTKKHLRLFPFKIPGRASKVFGNSRFSSTPHPPPTPFIQKPTTPKECDTRGEKGICAFTCVWVGRRNAHFP